MPQNANLSKIVKGLKPTCVEFPNPPPGQKAHPFPSTAIWCTLSHESFETPVEADQLATKHEEEEYNTRVNEKWKYCAKNDPKKMWKEIDWKGKSINRKRETLSEDTIHSYFKQIFQSPKTANKPTLDSISIPEETKYVEELDKDITIEEVNKSIAYGALSW